MLQLSLQTDYALRVLMFLADDQRRASTTEIADFYTISKDHVSKVAQRLTRSGYLRSIRGMGGGLELARPAAEISIGEVISSIEGDGHLLECVGASRNVCVIQPGCRLRSVLGEAERLQKEYLAGVTLQDVMPKRKKLYALKVPLD